MRHSSAGNQRGERCRHGDACGRSVLGHCALRHVDVQVIFFEQGRLIGEHGLHQAHRDLYRFLHDITELAGDGEFAASLGKKSFYEQDLAAGGCPGQSGNDTGLFLCQYARKSPLFV